MTEPWQYQLTVAHPFFGDPHRVVFYDPADARDWWATNRDRFDRPAVLHRRRWPDEWTECEWEDLP